jgi:hypothetical protein
MRLQACLVLFSLILGSTMGVGPSPAAYAATGSAWETASNGSVVVSIGAGGRLQSQDLGSSGGPNLVSLAGDNRISSIRWDGRFFVATSFFALFYSSDGKNWTRFDLPTGDYFDPGNVISDDEFFDASSMTQSEISTFIDSKVASCRASYVCLENYSERTWDRPATAMCDAYSSSGIESAAKIIKKVSQACGISAKVLLVLLQKEQGLVTHTWPSNWRFQRATGYACPDTAPCDTQYYGFYNQVYNAAKQFKRYANPPGTSRFFTWYPVGATSSVLLHPNSACGRSQFVIQNQATANLYYYTPYVPNPASLNAYSGTGDSCSSYGNRNFWRYYNAWFGNQRDFANWAITRGGVGAIVDQDGTTLRVDLNKRSWAYDDVLPGGRTKGVQLVGLDSGDNLIAQRNDGKQFSLSASQGWAAVDPQLLSNPSLSIFTSTEVPTVSGSAVLGLTLTASVADWDPVPDSYTYQWLVNGKPIKKATGSTYVPGKKDVGKRISVRVAGVKSGYVTTTETSSQTSVVTR